jgi:hypothetical protein
MENITDFQTTICDTDNHLNQNFVSNKTLSHEVDTKNDPANIKISGYLKRAEEDGGLTLTNLHHLAKSVGINNPEKITRKVELIRNIQKASNQRPCFRSEASKRCTEKACHWRTECRKMVAVWHR